MEKCTSDLGPYRATKLWNDVIRTFRTSIPVGRHRRHMRNYENCFTATEAIDWLFSYLGKNPEFGPEVTRVQTLQLLRKFYKSGVFENIRGTKPVRSEDFKDNGDLYRVTFNSPLRILRTPRRAPLVTRSNTAPTNESNDIERILNKEAELIPAALPECHLIARQLTVQDTEDVWKSVVLNRLQIALGLPNLDAILDVSSVNPQHIIHNATRIGKNDVVMVLDKANDLPHWVLSAMKCLVNWPNASGTGSCLPNYPGFEGDVFKVVKDYFCNLGIPLSTYAMYDVFINVLDLFSERGKRCAVEVLQLVALLLPPGNRRKLHLLLKFMSKVCQNGSLSLCNSVTNRALVLQTFLRCIVNADSEADYDELLAIRLVMFLMDNHQEIFRVPCMVKTQVEERIIFLNREKIHYTLDDPSSITYCEQVSKVEYENQRLTHSERALVGLLDGIMNDKRLSQKEKKKRLKQFKEAYPKIHAERFPPTDEGGAFPVQNKQSFKPTILQKLRNMRM